MLHLFCITANILSGSSAESKLIIISPPVLCDHVYWIFTIIKFTFYFIMLLMSIIEFLGENLPAQSGRNVENEKMHFEKLVLLVLIYS